MWRSSQYSSCLSLLYYCETYCSLFFKKIHKKSENYHSESFSVSECFSSYYKAKIKSVTWLKIACLLHQEIPFLRTLKQSVHVSAQMEMMQFFPTSEFDCNESITGLDACVFEKSLASAPCLLPFLNESLSFRAVHIYVHLHCICFIWDKAFTTIIF